MGAGIFNGDVGIIREINDFAELLTVEFDEGKMIEYSFKQLEELELAYAITIHKSQGSEYPAVIIPMYNGPRTFMTCNLIYTAVTRACSCGVFRINGRILHHGVQTVVWSRNGIRA